MQFNFFHRCGGVWIKLPMMSGLLLVQWFIKVLMKTPQRQIYLQVGGLFQIVFIISFLQTLMLQKEPQCFIFHSISSFEHWKYFSNLHLKQGWGNKKDFGLLSVLYTFYRSFKCAYKVKHKISTFIFLSNLKNIGRYFSKARNWQNTF